MTIRASAVCLFLAALAPGVACAGDDDGWVKLGEREVAFRAERDVIEVGAGDGRFNKLRFHVKGNGVEILDVDVVFGNGEKQDVQVREHIAEGGSTRAIDLPGEARVIKRIGFAYKTRGKAREGRATVAVWGKLDGGAPAGPAEEWVKLGHRQVNFAVEKDTIPVGAGDGLFKRLRFEVEGNDIELLSIKVRFGNGEVEDLTVRETIKEGGRTRAIDLPGALRVIKEIDLVYSTEGRPREGKATVKAFGLKAGEGGAKPAGGADRKDDDQGWELLGRREVDFKVDRDVIPVTVAEGRFKRIRLQVEGNAIDVLDLEVHFGNGEKHDVQVRATIEQGGSTRVIDLPGEARVIKKVVMTYKVAKRMPGRGEAVVKVWGKQS